LTHSHAASVTHRVWKGWLIDTGLPMTEHGAAPVIESEGETDASSTDAEVDALNLRRRTS